MPPFLIKALCMIKKTQLLAEGGITFNKYKEKDL